MWGLVGKGVLGLWVGWGWVGVVVLWASRGVGIRMLTVFIFCDELRTCYKWVTRVRKPSECVVEDSERVAEEV